MKLLQSRWSRVTLFVGITLVVCGIAVFVLGPDRIIAYFRKGPGTDSAKAEAKPAGELVRTAEGTPIDPPTLRLTAVAAERLGITSETIKKVVHPTPEHPRSLPPQMGTLAFDNDRLFNLRSRFAGEVSEILDCPIDQQGSVPRLPVKPGQAPQGPNLFPTSIRTRQFSVGDRVKKGDLLAIVWSKDLGDKKAALVDATIDLHRDTQRLKQLEDLYFKGLTSKNQLFDAERTVRKDYSACIAAERTLQMWKLTPDEIAAVKKEAKTIIEMNSQDEGKIIIEKNRDPSKEKDWARSEVRALTDGVIVEKNTHFGDWVDPANYGTPMFRIADLSKLHIWINPNEEYLPALQNFLLNPDVAPLSWDIYLQADPKAPPMSGALLRIAPSILYDSHMPLLVGIVDNPKNRLLVGQFVTVTVKVAVEKDLLELPTSAVNEEKDHSVVFVQRDAKKLEFTMRPVTIVHRFKDFVYVRMESADEGNALQEGDRVLTESVVELTRALRDLLAKEKLNKEKPASRAP